MIVFTKDTQYNQCKREDILNFQNQKYINKNISISILFTMKSCHDMTVNYMKLKRCSKERKINFWSNGKDMKNPHGLIANLS